MAVNIGRVGRIDPGVWTTVELMEAWETALPAPSFMRDNLFPRIQTTSVNTVIVDYWRETQRLAPWVSPIVRGRVINRDKARTSAFEPPYLKPVRPMFPHDLWDRAPGEAIGGPDPVAREGYYIAQDMMTLDHMIARVEEKICCDCITTGKITAATQEGDEWLPLAELDYEIQPRVVVTPPWDDPTADPLRDIKVAMRQLSAMAGAQCDFVVMGSAASDAFEQHQTVIDGYNKYWIRPGVLEPKEVEWGIQVLGSHRGISLMSYGSEYQDPETGDMVPYLDPTLVVLAAKTAGTGSMGYAAVWQENEEQGIHALYEGTRIWQKYFESEVRYLRCSSRPVPVPPPSQNWLVMKVLA
jgi:hypothetical protein